MEGWVEYQPQRRNELKEKKTGEERKDLMMRRRKKRFRDVEEQTVGRKKKFKYTLIEEGWGERKDVTDSAETVCQVIIEAVSERAWISLLLRQAENQETVNTVPVVLNSNTVEKASVTRKRKSGKTLADPQQKLIVDWLWKAGVSFEMECGNSKEEECRWEGLNECRLSHTGTSIKNVETESSEQPADSSEDWQDESHVSLAGSLETQDEALTMSCLGDDTIDMTELVEDMDKYMEGRDISRRPLQVTEGGVDMISHTLEEKSSDKKYLARALSDSWKSRRVTKAILRSVMEEVSKRLVIVDMLRSRIRKLAQDKKQKKLDLARSLSDSWESRSMTTFVIKVVMDSVDVNG